MANLPACCLDLDIDVMDFIFPRRLNDDGLEFLDAHGLLGMSVGERDKLLAGGDYQGKGVVKLRHRCAQLQDDGRCGIYATRPAICRAYDCARRHEQLGDCACHGQGFIAVGDLFQDARA